MTSPQSTCATLPGVTPGSGDHGVDTRHQETETEQTVDVQVSNNSNNSTTTISYNVDRQSYQQQHYQHKYDDSTPLLNRQGRGTTPIAAASQGKRFSYCAR